MHQLRLEQLNETRSVYEIKQNVLAFTIIWIESFLALHTLTPIRKMWPVLRLSPFEEM